MSADFNADFNNRNKDAALETARRVFEAEAEAIIKAASENSKIKACD